MDGYVQFNWTELNIAMIVFVFVIVFCEAVKLVVS